MRILVCGGRDYADYDHLSEILASYLLDDVDHIIQGGAKGADALAKRWAMNHSISCATFHANWVNEGKAAGPIRNLNMLEHGKPDLVIAFPGGAGTRNMMAKALQAGVKVREIT